MPRTKRLLERVVSGHLHRQGRGDAFSTTSWAVCVGVSPRGVMIMVWCCLSGVSRSPYNTI